MRMILFQVVNGLDADRSRGIPTWAFWLLVFIIAALLIFILVRDRRVRAKLRAFFSWIGNKIRTARIKSKISRKNSERSKLITRLGQLAWDNRIEVVDIVPETGEMEKLDHDRVRIEGEIKKIDREIEACQSGSDAFKKEQNSRISGIEEEKAPVVARHKELLRQIDSLNHKIKENEKSTDKLKRDIRHQTLEIEKAEADGYLSNIEKDARKEECQKKINALKQKKSEYNSIRIPLETEIGDINPRINDQKFKIDEKDARIEELNKMLRERLKKDSENVDHLQKNRKALNIKKIGIDKQIAVLFGKSGEKLNQNRSDRDEFRETYSQIDLIDQHISELESRVK